MTEAEVRALIHAELKARGIVAGPLDDFFETKLRTGARQLVQDDVTGPNANESARNAVASLRKLVARLLPAWEALIAPYLDRLEAAAGDPVNGEAIAEGVRAVLLPYLKTPT